jgi:hypothetical protein
MQESTNNKPFTTGDYTHINHAFSHLSNKPFNFIMGKHMGICAEPGSGRKRFGTSPHGLFIDIYSEWGTSGITRNGATRSSSFTPCFEESFNFENKDGVALCEKIDENGKYGYYFYYVKGVKSTFNDKQTQVTAESDPLLHARLTELYTRAMDIKSSTQNLMSTDRDIEDARRDIPHHDCSTYKVKANLYKTLRENRNKAVELYPEQMKVINEY